MSKFAPTGMPNPMTAIGDFIAGGTGGSPTKVAAGSNGQFLQSQGAGSTLIWASIGSPQSFIGSHYYLSSDITNYAGAVIKFNSSIYDTNSSYDTASGFYLVASTGYYEILCSIEMTTSTSASGTVDLSTSIKSNGSLLYQLAEMSPYLPSSDTELFKLVGGVICNLTSGVTLGFYGSMTSGGGTISTKTIVSGSVPYVTYFTIRYLGT